MSLGGPDESVPPPQAGRSSASAAARSVAALGAVSLFIVKVPVVRQGTARAPTATVYSPDVGMMITAVKADERLKEQSRRTVGKGASSPMGVPE
jgi:hypothetical protein